MLNLASLEKGITSVILVLRCNISSTFLVCHWFNEEMIKSMGRLLTNPIYMLASIAICIDCLILGFIAFLPKYFEVYFHKTASVANILGGRTLITGRLFQLYLTELVFIW